jgi:hypothetical protein
MRSPRAWNNLTASGKRSTSSARVSRSGVTWPSLSETRGRVSERRGHVTGCAQFSRPRTRPDGRPPARLSEAHLGQPATPVRSGASHEGQYTAAPIGGRNSDSPPAAALANCLTFALPRRYIRQREGWGLCLSLLSWLRFAGCRLTDFQHRSVIQAACAGTRARPERGMRSIYHGQIRRRVGH